MDLGISHTAENKPGPPHEAMFFVLTYLPLFELLSISEVCRSLRDALNNDILPWLNIIVKKPLNSRLYDDILMKITSKANGRLRTLALRNCVKLTDDGLQGVIAKNPHINKLYIPACTGLTPEGVIRAVKTLNQHHHSLISLKINGIYNISREHLETLRSLIQVDQTQQQQQRKHFSNCINEETNRSIDMDICPKCNEVRMVFDCPIETCERKSVRVLSQCRGCYLCIPRCEECGRCVEIEDQGEGEAACADVLCTDCWLQLPKCNFCNKPYCNQHADQQCCLAGSSGFVCGSCYAKFIGNSYH